MITGSLIVALALIGSATPADHPPAPRRLGDRGTKLAAAARPTFGDDGGARQTEGDAGAAEGVDAARQRFASGLQLYRAADYPAALSEFEAAYAKAPNYRLLYNIGICRRQLADYIGATRDLQKYLAEGGDGIDSARREEVEKELVETRGLFAHVIVTVSVADAELIVDDQPPGKVPADPLALNPGRHKIWAMKAGFQPASKELTLEASQSVDLLLDLRPSPKQTQKVSFVGAVLQSRVGQAALVAVPLATLGLVVAFGRRRRRAAPPRDMELAADVPESSGGSVPDLVSTNAVPIVFEPNAAGDGPKLARPMVLDSDVRRDIGRVKPTNQDSYLVKKEENLFVVCDGIGGNAGGGIASALSVRAIAKCFEAPDPESAKFAHLPREAAELVYAVYSANRDVRKRQGEEWNISEMGTTCVSMRFSAEQKRMYIAHIGDSRAYRLRDNVLTQMTTDHTMAELGMVGPRAQHLSRAVGSDPCPKVDVLIAEPAAGDAYLLCSDGLTKMITVEQLQKVLRESPSATRTVTTLVDLANQQGGQDNITVVVVRVIQA